MAKMEHTDGVQLRTIRIAMFYSIQGINPCLARLSSLTVAMDSLIITPNRQVTLHVHHSSTKRTILKTMRHNKLPKKRTPAEVTTQIASKVHKRKVEVQRSIPFGTSALGDSQSLIYKRLCGARAEHEE